VHILTKILIVVVTLLVVMLVPLVMVNATNEASFKSRFQAAQAESASLQSQAMAASNARLASEAALGAQIRTLEAEVATARQQVVRQSAEARRLQGELDRSSSMLARMATTLSQIQQTGEANTKITEGLIAEADALRKRETEASTRTVALEQQVADLRDTEGVLRAEIFKLQEQLKESADQRDRDAATIARYEASVGSLRTAAAGEVRRVADRNLRAKVVKVIDDPAGKLASIDAGERDGVQPGWVLTISDGTNYIANLRVIEVDVNRAVGLVELEDPAAGRLVSAGQTAIARQGE
jgi:predicted  nucleic acid-binding Zn-ribbon protein